MKKDFTYKITVGDNIDFKGRGHYLLIRALTEEKITPQACFNNIIEYKRQVINTVDFNRHNGWAHLKSQLERLSQYEIMYSKINEVSQNDKTYYYYQIVIEGEPICPPKEINWRHDLFYQFNVIESVSNDVPMSIIPFSVGRIELSIGASCNLNFCRCLEGKLNELFKKLSAYYKENIALMFRTDITKKYNKNSIVKIDGTIYDNLAQALNHKDNKTIFGSCFDSVNTFTFVQWLNKNGVFGFRKIYTTKIHATYYKDMLITYDSKIAYETMTPHFEDLYNSGLRDLQIIQFSGNKALYFSGNSYDHIPRMIFRFVDISKIITGKSNFTPNRNPMGVICVKGHKGQKNIYIQLSYNSSNVYRGTLIIPIVEGQVNNDILQYLIQEIKNGGLSNRREEYLNSLKGKIDITEDIISTWFNYCINTKKKGTHDLVSAYEKMKRNLEAEYAILKNYMNVYDFSKCMAIPAIKMDKKLKENYYKSLHVGPKTVIIKSIKREQIKPITIIQPTITFMETTNKVLIRESFPLKDYYKVKDNVLDLQYNKLRGDAIYVKTQDRR